MDNPKDRYINPDVGYYGQTTKIDDTCYVNTGRVGEMTDFFEHKPPTFSLQDHACECDYFNMNAADHPGSPLQLGTGGSVQSLDSSTNRVDIETTDNTQYINLRQHKLLSSQRVNCPGSYIFTSWFKPRSNITAGHYQVNLWDHQDNQGLNRFGFIISLSSDETSNDGTLSVLIGDGTDAWKTHNIPGQNTWLMDTRYHVAVIQNNTNLKVYINNEKQLDVSTTALSHISPTHVGITSSNTSAPHPLAFSTMSFLTVIPDLPETLIHQHYNGDVPTPRST
jgi:hypothetical protein